MKTCEECDYLFDAELENVLRPELQEPELCLVGKCRRFPPQNGWVRVHGSEWCGEFKKLE